MCDGIPLRTRPALKDSGERGQLIILDELGKVLLAERFSENKTFNLSFLPAGIYFFSIETEKEVFKEKFVKLK